MAEPDPIQPHRLVLQSPKFKRSLLSEIGRVVNALPLNDRAHEIRAENAERQLEALGAFRAYLGEQDHEDPRFFVLRELSRAQLGGAADDRDAFVASRSQARLLNMYGMRRERPTPAAAFELLIAAGAADVLRDRVRAHSELDLARRRAEDLQREAEAALEAMGEVKAERDELERSAERGEREREKLTKRIEQLEAFLAASDSGSSRRKAIADEKGIYETLTDGRLGLEIGFADAEKKQRWRKLPADASIEDARKLRASLHGKPYQPERDGQPAVDDDNAEQASPGSPGDDAGEES